MAFLPQRKRGRLLRNILLGVLFVFAAGSFWYVYLVNSPNSMNASLKQFVVQPGEGSTIISNHLNAQGLIKNAIVFQLYVWRHGISSQLKPGEYELAQNLNITAVADLLWRGPGDSKEKKLTFIEGWTLQQFADYLETQGVVPAQDFLAVAQKKSDWWDDYPALRDRPRTTDLEGYLFPDTYRVYRDASAETIIRRLLDNLETRLTPELRADIAKQGKTIHEVLTMASILEKEVSTDADRSQAADIFYKRIVAGIPLQSDATVNYLTNKGTTRPSAQDLLVESLYNTYRHKGLPPGPICNPGLSAIKAAIYPTSNPYYYFLTTPDGTVIYSKTHDEHVAAKAKYYPQ